MSKGPLYLEPFEIGHAIAPAAWLVGSFLIGYLFYRIAFRKLRSAATLTSWGGDEIVIGAVHDVLLIWFVLGGALGAIRSVPLRDDLVSSVEKLLLVVLILSGTWVAARVAADSLKLYVLRSGSLRGGSSILVNVSRITVFVVGIMVLLQALGIPIGPLLGALGVGGIAVALALQDVLASFFAGIQLLASRKIMPGDFIELESGQSGTVVDINWRNTTIRTLPNNDVIIPNATLANQIVTNYNRPEQEMSVIVGVGVHYDSDLAHVEEVTIEVARETLREVEGGVPEFEPFIRYNEFADSSINFSTILRTREVTNRFLLTHEFIKRLHTRYEQEGISIPFPIRTLELPDEWKPPARRAKAKKR